MKAYEQGYVASLTIGDLCREPELEGYSRRQLEYAIREHGVEPVGRAGIIRLFSRSQIPVIKTALRHTTKAR